MFHRFIVASETGRRRSAAGNRISPSTVEQYRYVEKLLIEYQDVYSHILRLRLLHRSPLSEIHSEKKYWEDFFKKFSGFMYQRKHYFDQFAGSVFKTLKTFLNYLLVEKSMPIGQFHKKFRVPGEIILPVVLSPAQLRFLIGDRDFQNSLSLALRRTLDIFIFGCTVGLRWSDLAGIKKANLRYTTEGVWLEVRTHKTGATVNIPLPEYAVAIVEKYKSKAGKYILPRLACSNVNLQIKRIMEKASWTYNIPRIRMRQGKPVEIKNKDGHCYRFCDHITAHTMRRTAITTLLILGVPELVVRKISGHAAGSKEFYRYVSIAQDYLEHEVRKAFDQLSPEFVPSA